MTPFFMEIWYERNLKIACVRVFKQLVTCSPLLFIFQAKVIGYYVTNELRYGGAGYVSTGRGLPTERRPFISLTKNKKGAFEGLYLDYAAISYYDGTRLLIGAILVRVLGGVSSSLGRLAYMLIPAWISIG